MSTTTGEESKAVAVYEGLNSRQRMGIIAGAVLVVIISLVFSGFVMFQTLGSLQFNEVDRESVEKVSGGIAEATNKAVLRAYAISAIVNLKLVANKQAIIVVAFAAAMAFGAVGFALFLIGADGAFKLNAQTGGNAGGAKLVFSGTAPGLLCFLLAAILVGMGIQHRSLLDLGPVTFPAAVGSERNGGVPPSDASSITEGELKALERLQGGAK